MSLDPARTPVVIATGQSVDRSRESGPIELAEQACRAALDTVPGLGACIERVSVVNILARRAGPAPASDLAKRLGLNARVTESTVIGGNMPQALVTRAAADIAAGSLSATLVAGAEAVRGTRLKPQGTVDGRPAPEDEPDPDPVFGLERQDLSDEERAAGLLIPVFVYPLFESVLASRAGRSNEEQRAHIGRFLAPLSAVAASNPHAWFREALSPEAIAVASASNRLVAEPYTKRMAAYLGSAHGSAVAVTSLETARSLGVADRAVFVWSGSDADEVWYPLARPDLGSAPALGRALSHTLGSAGVSADDVGLFDLYSCFPSAVQVAAAELGIALDDPRGLTVTGGLPYFGGPGSSYAGNSIATMVDRLAGRSGSGSESLGLVTGVGWYLTKHSVGLYGAAPPPHGFHADAGGIGPAEAPLEIAPSVEEPTVARVDAGTVIYDRTGSAVSAPVMVTLADASDRRLAAVALPDELAAIAESASTRPLVGRTVRVLPGSPPAYSID